MKPLLAAIGIVVVIGLSNGHDPKPKNATLASPTQMSQAKTLIEANGYVCLDVTFMSPYVMSLGYHVRCHLYTYELTDKGGHWQVTAN